MAVHILRSLAELGMTEGAALNLCRPRTPARWRNAIIAGSIGGSISVWDLQDGQKGGRLSRAACITLAGLETRPPGVVSD